MRHMSETPLCHPATLAVAILLGLGSGGALLAQEWGELPVDTSESLDYTRGPSQIVLWDAQEIRSRLLAVDYRNLTPEETDDLYLLARTRPEVSLPLFEEAVRNGLETPEEMLQVVDFLSYGASEQALSALSRLTADEKPDRTLLNRSISRLLDYADGWSNPYTLAYQAMKTGNPEVARQVVDWVRDKAEHGYGFSDWASALLATRSGAMPLEELLNRDPLLSRLGKGQLPEGLRTELERQLREGSAPPQ